MIIYLILKPKLILNIHIYLSNNLFVNINVSYFVNVNEPILMTHENMNNNYNNNIFTR